MHFGTSSEHLNSRVSSREENIVLWSIYVDDYSLEWRVILIKPYRMNFGTLVCIRNKLVTEHAHFTRTNDAIYKLCGFMQL